MSCAARLEWKSCTWIIPRTCRKFHSRLPGRGPSSFGTSGCFRLAHRTLFCRHHLREVTGSDTGQFPIDGPARAHQLSTSLSLAFPGEPQLTLPPARYVSERTHVSYYELVAVYCYCLRCVKARSCHVIGHTVVLELYMLSSREHAV